MTFNLPQVKRCHIPSQKPTVLPIAYKYCPISVKCYVESFNIWPALLSSTSSRFPPLAILLQATPLDREQALYISLLPHLSPQPGRPFSKLFIFQNPSYLGRPRPFGISTIMFPLIPAFSKNLLNLPVLLLTP